MKANPNTYYDPENKALFAASTAEVLTGATTFNALPKEKQEELKYSFTPIALDYFADLNIAPTLDNVLKHQNNIRKAVAQEVAFINAEMQLIEQEENFLGLGKKAKQRRASKRSSDEWSTQGNWGNSPQRPQNTSFSKNKTDDYNWRNSWGKDGSWQGDSVKIDMELENQLAKVDGKKDGKNWQETLKSILGATTTVVGAIQANKNEQQNTTTQQNGMPFYMPEQQKKKKILGLEPVVGIAIILVFIILFGFAIWQISQNNSK